MDENKLNEQELENEEVSAEAEKVEEIAEEVTETVEEAAAVVEDAVEEAAEAVEEVFDAIDEDAEYQEEVAYDEESETVKPVKSYKKSAIIAWALVAILLIVDGYYFMTNIYNKYNHMGYLDTNGHTIGEAVAGMGMDFDEFKELYGLPKDMRKDTNMNAAQSMIPVENMAKLNNTDVETLKTTYKFGDEITGKSTWGEAVESMALRDYVGEEGFADFKAEFDLGDDVTLDTKWGEIRKKVEKMQVAQRLAEAQKTEEPTEAPTEEPAEVPAEEPADANAEGEEVAE